MSAVNLHSICCYFYPSWGRWWLTLILCNSATSIVVYWHNRLNSSILLVRGHPHDFILGCVSQYATCSTTLLHFENTELIPATIDRASVYKVDVKCQNNADTCNSSPTGETVSDCCIRVLLCYNLKPAGLGIQISDVDSKLLTWI